jgi:uncharacterized protein (TIGR03437 family)
MRTSFVLLLVLAASAHAQSPGAFTATGNMITPRFFHTATLLLNGKVLVAGGYTVCYLGSPCLPVASAELYDPATGTFTPTGSMTTAYPTGSAVLRGQGAVWHASTGETASSGNPALAGEALSMYTFSLADGVIPPQVAVGGRLAEVLYFGPAPGYPGYYQINVRVPSGLAPGPAVAMRLNYLGRPSNEVTIGVK